MRLPAPNAIIGGTIIGIVIVCALFGAIWTPYDPLQAQLRARKSRSRRVAVYTGSAPTSSAATC